MAVERDSQRVSIDGHVVTLTNLGKVLYPVTGTTKAEVIDYYSRIAPALIPHAAGRPVTRKRWVHGVGTAAEPGQVFFQKDLGSGPPEWVQRRSITHSSRTNVYPLLEDRATLVWFAQLAALELHVPQWRFDDSGAPAHPDRLVLDLDPGPDAGILDCAEVARWARSILTDMGLDPMPVTSGSKGIHLYAALDGTHSSDQVSAMAKELARALEADHPGEVVSSMKKALRTGKVLVDWSQNNAAKTTIAPYSLRGRERPLVAAPRNWDELDEPGLRQLDHLEVLERVERWGDPLRELSSDRLAEYRRKRDPLRTPEPVPARGANPSGPGETGLPSFVIQEHHARRLHYDFRLERDGVLASWAVPKGVPADTKTNHLAVQTEDHPLDYGTFEGVIPKGEYGAGAVTIWDAGGYALEKWRDGKEVIVTLHGRERGGLGGTPVKVALIHTGSGGSAENWLLHRMSIEAPTRPFRVDDYSPMLAAAGSERDVVDDADWALELKWDGIRSLVYVQAGAVRLVSRSGKELTAAYPELADPELAPLPAQLRGVSAVLDGEIVALDSRGRPSFARLQKRMNLTRPDEITRVSRDVPVHLLLFDILELDGESQLARTYTRRRSTLEDAIADRYSGRVQVPPALDTGLKDALDASRSMGLEGIVAKRRTSRYAPGKRSGAWLKLKHHLTQEVVVGGWRPGRGRRAGTVGSLLLGIPGDGKLRFVGKVGTGFDDEQLDELRSLVARLARKTSPLEGVPNTDAKDAHWITPRLVGEVEFGEWTESGRLRQPSWRGWRPDKKPEDVVREG